MFKWVVCPHCGKKLFQIRDGAVIKGLRIFCKQCKKTIDVSL